MPHTGIHDLAARLGIDLDLSVEPTKEDLLSAINVELRDLQVPQPTAAQHARQVALIEARGELLGTGQAGASPSTDLVPVSLVSQMVEAIQSNLAKEPMAAPSRPDATLTMRTNVKATATQASADFTKARSLPFAGAGALAVSAYGLRTYFNVGDVELPSDWFYPLFWTAVFIIGVGYLASTVAQRQASRILRALYNPDIQEEALNHLGDESVDYFGSHSQRMIEMDGEPGRPHRAIDSGDGIIVNRSLYRYGLRELAYGRVGSLRSVVDLLSTVDLAAATDDATGLALDRLCDLKIIEPVVYQRRQAFRLIWDRPEIEIRMGSGRE
ncbi:hypothetical protein NG697_12610 [Pseudarthrobacter sp. MDT3-26]|uniref:hypothetical protein n=1 Tax=Pseudarthrobacter raffinosi TaxID=2953651 RepID=UPI00208E225B|nr:hypothetical protein [Pseudarthrobacter sp. MDT3-26]MCO4263753.1 hypothetical protein [Pseudarthrobacter sp. MDT3-26]